MTKEIGGRRRRLLGAGALILVSGAIALTVAERVPASARAPGVWGAPAGEVHGGEGPAGTSASSRVTLVRDLVAVEWSPEQPVQGTIFTVRVQPLDPAVTRVSGELAGEPLHFEVGDDGAYTALAAVPVDSTGAVELRLEARAADGRVERRTESVPVAEGAYRMEKLTVAPRYGGGYDEATAARIRRESARAREVSRRSHETPRLWEGPFVRPRPSRITSGFGNGREYNGRVQSRHTGTDFAGAVGAPVQAAARGVVRIVDSFYLGGNVVYIDHGAGLVTAYLHLSEQSVAEGDTVEAGQVIGKVGATGRVTGPHLHWIVRYGNISVDGLSLPGIESDR